MNPQYWQALGALIVAGGALYGVVTALLLRTLKAEIGLSEERMKVLITGLKVEMTAMEARLSTKIETVKTELGAAEARLNERLADKLNEYLPEPPITRLEERRFR